MRFRTLLALAVLAVVGASAAAWLLPRKAPSAAPLPPMDADVEAPTTGGETDPWVVPDGLAPSALYYDRFETFGREDGLPSERVTCLLVEGDTLTVGTDRGLAVRRDGTWTAYGPADGLSHRYVTSLARDTRTGDLWISTLQGLCRLSGGTFRTFTQTNSGLMNDVVYHVVVREGLVWAATGAGTSCFDASAGTWVVYDHENSIMHEPWCYALALGPQRAWIGVWGGGVVELDLDTHHWREYRDPDGEMELDLLRDDGPIHDVTSFIAFDAGVLWQATYFGLARYDGRQWRSYLQTDTGLPGDFLHHVHARGHTAFLASDQGFGVFDGETCVSYRRNDDGTCDVRTWKGGKETGHRVLPTAPADNYVLWVQGGEHEVWLATGRGLTHGRASEEGR